jgi:hypothetical protein
MTRITTTPSFVAHSELDIIKEFNLKKALSYVSMLGLYLEFGVWKGNSINFIANLVSDEQVVYGFDSWYGLPEDWINPRKCYPAGSFSADGIMPIVLPNVNLISGLFEDTIPKFAAIHKEQISFVHIDCDLYSSTKTIFNYLGPLFVKGSVVVFDEYDRIGSEEKAFNEFLEEFDKTATAVFAIERQMTFIIN